MEQKLNSWDSKECQKTRRAGKKRERKRKGRKKKGKGNTLLF